MNQAMQFVKEAYSELQKVAWLPRKAAVQSTIFVFLVVILVAIYVSGVDFLLSLIVSSVLGGR